MNYEQYKQTRARGLNVLIILGASKEFIYEVYPLQLEHDTRAQRQQLDEMRDFAERLRVGGSLRKPTQP